MNKVTLYDRIMENVSREVINALNMNHNLELDDASDDTSVFKKSPSKLLTIDDVKEKTMQHLEDGDFSKDTTDLALLLGIKLKANDKTFRRIVRKAKKQLGNNANLNWIDTSEVTDMAALFMNLPFNGDISEWNVSNVKDMYGMFWGSIFDKDISKWDVSNVKNSSYIFSECPIREEYKPKFN